MGRPSDWVLMCGASRDSILHWSSTSACLLALSRCGLVAGSVSWLEVPGQTSRRGAHSLAYWMTALESQSRWTIRQSLDRFQGRPGPCTSSTSISARQRLSSYRYRTLSIRTRCWCSQGSSCLPLNALNRCASRRCPTERTIRAEQSFLDGQLARAAVTFKLYRLAKNENGAAGAPRWRFQLSATRVSANPYCDVGEAFAHESLWRE